MSKRLTVVPLFCGFHVFSAIIRMEDFSAVTDAPTYLFIYKKDREQHLSCLRGLSLPNTSAICRMQNDSRFCNCPPFLWCHEVRCTETLGSAAILCLPCGSAISGLQNRASVTDNVPLIRRNGADFQRGDAWDLIVIPTLRRRCVCVESCRFHPLPNRAALIRSQRLIGGHPRCYENGARRVDVSHFSFPPDEVWRITPKSPTIQPCCTSAKSIS